MTTPGDPPGYPPYPGGPDPDPGPDRAAPGGFDPRTQTACVRHPDRPTGLSCARCERASCPECLREASVGYQCVDCVREGSRQIRSPGRGRAVLGAGTAAPLVVPWLIGLNVGIFLLTALQARSLNENSGAGLFELWSLRPIEVADGQWWRLVTTGFLHYGPVHLAFNMWALWVLGRDIELVLGRARFLLLYLVSLLGGAAAALLFSGPRDETAGASGAVFGLMAAAGVLLHRLGRSTRPVIILLVVNLAISLLPGISWQGHIGGLVVGAAASAVLVYAPRARQTVVQVGGIAAIVVVLLVVMAVRAATLGGYPV